MGIPFLLYTFYTYSRHPTNKLWRKTKTTCPPHMNWTTNFIMHNCFPFGWPKRKGVDGSG